MIKNQRPSESEKSDNLSVIKRILKYIFAYKWDLLLAAVLMLSANVVGLIAPELSGRAIAGITSKGNVDFQTVLKYTLLMLLCYALSSLLGFILSYVMINLSRKVVYKLRKEVFEHLVDLHIDYFDKNQTGDIISRLSYDIDTVNASLANDLLQICSGVIILVGSAVMMIRISPILILASAVTIPILVFFSIYRVKKVKPLFRRRSAALGELNGYVEEMLSGQKTTSAYCKEEIMIDRFDKHNDEATDAYYQADYQGSIIGPSVAFINNITLSLITALGAILHITRGLTVANLSTFILYSRKFSGPVNEAANIVSEIQSATSAARRIFYLLDQEPEDFETNKENVLTEIRGQIELKNVNFEYVENTPVLKNISAMIPSGSKTALVGPTGGGKSTFVSLLMRFYDPKSGEILIDGKKSSDYSLDSVRSCFSMVLQETWLFGGTIADNIRYGREDATFDEIVEAAKNAKIHDFITGLPNGYDTVIDENGVNISKGQKQLLTIARAMLSNARILILDEATSNVDSRTEINLQNAMDALTAGRTSIIVAHRLSTIKNADNILVIKNGELIEQGTHDELLEKGGFYSELYSSQFVSTED